VRVDDAKDDAVMHVVGVQHRPVVGLI
jgi:hypothetical protein